MAELHLHLDGIPNPDNSGTDTELSKQLKDLFPVTTTEGFSKWWKIIDSKYAGNLKIFFPIMENHITSLRNQGACYVEIMVSKSEMAKDYGVITAEFEELRHKTGLLENNQIQVEFIICLGRNKSPEILAEQAERVLYLYKKGFVCGVALAGPEDGYPVKPFRKTFEKFKDSGIGIEIHAGEWSGPESVWDAIENGFPERIGHGLSAFRDEKLIDYIIEKNIHIEFCPSSNMALTAYKKLKEHPIGTAIKRKMNFSINTDDPGPLGCSLEHEFDLVRNAFGMDPAQEREILKNTLKAGFCKKFRYKNTKEVMELH